MKLVIIIVGLCCLALTAEALPATITQRCILWFCKPKSFEPAVTVGAATGPTTVTENKKTDSKVKTKKCDEITKYSIDWFVQNATPNQKPKPSTCLFYTKGLSLKANSYAKKNDMTTIWHVWPGGFYNTRQVTSNPLRCIMQDKTKDQRVYFENMSKAFARMCDVLATVMDSNITPSKHSFATVNQKGIWYNAEFPVLKAGYLKNKVNVIEAISEDGKIVFDYWVRKGVQATNEDNPLGNADNRDDDLDMDIVGDVANGVTDHSDLTSDPKAQSDAHPEWWEEDGVLSDEELMDWGDKV